MRNYQEPVWSRRGSGDGVVERTESPVSEPSRSKMGYMYAVSGEVGPHTELVRGKSGVSAASGRPCSGIHSSLHVLNTAVSHVIQTIGDTFVNMLYLNQIVPLPVARRRNHAMQWWSSTDNRTV